MGRRLDPTVCVCIQRKGKRKTRTQTYIRSLHIYTCMVGFSIKFGQKLGLEI